MNFSFINEVFVIQRDAFVHGDSEVTIWQDGDIFSRGGDAMVFEREEKMRWSVVGEQIFERFHGEKVVRGGNGSVDVAIIFNGIEAGAMLGSAFNIIVLIDHFHARV